MYYNIKMKKILILFILLTLPIITVAGTIYVSNIGDSSAPGSDSEVTAYQSIQAAIDTAVSGDTVYIFKGNYVLTSTIELTSANSGLTIVGADSEGTVINRNSIGYNAFAFHLKNVDAVTIKNLGITNAFSAVFAETVTNSVISSNEIYNCHSDGIFIGYSDTNTISGNTVRNNGGFGIYLHNSDSNTVSNNIIEQNSLGIMVYYGSIGNVVSHNYISQNSANGIRMDNSAYNNFFFNKIIKNGGHGFKIFNSDNSKIENNEMENNVSDGCYLENSTNDTVQNDTFIENSGAGIFLYNSNNINISYNSNSANGYGALLIEGSSPAAFSQTITGNTNDFGNVVVLDGQIGTIITNETFSTLILLNSSNCTLRDVAIMGGSLELISSDNIHIDSLTLSKTGGIVTFQSQKINIANSKILSAKQGFYIQSSDTLSASRVLINSAVYGAYLDSSSFIDFYNITQAGNAGQYGFYLNNTDSVLIKNSIISGNSYGIYSAADVTFTTVKYSDFWNNSTNVFNTGSASDTIGEGSITGDPDFLNTVDAGNAGFYSLSSISASKDMGDPADTVYPGWHNRIDIGYKEYKNHAPTPVITVSDTTVAAGDNVTLSETGSYDIDGDTLTHIWVQLSGDSIAIADSSAPIINISPAVSGSYIFQLMVSDGEFTDTIEATIIATVSLGGTVKHETTGESGILIKIYKNDVIFKTALSDSVGHFEVSNLEKSDYRVCIDTSDAISVRPGTYAYNNLSTSKRNMEFSYNNLPQIKTEGDTLLKKLSSYTLDASPTSDKDDDILSYNWNQVSGETVVISNSAQSQAQFTPIKYDTYVFSFSVSDGIDTVTTLKTVIFENLRPIARVVSETICQNTDIPIELSAENSSDSNSDALTFNWAQVSGEAVALSDTNDSVARFMTNRIDTFIFQVAVSDGYLSDTKTVTVITSGKITGEISYFYPSFGITGRTGVSVQLNGTADSYYITGTGQLSAGKYIFNDLSRGVYTLHLLLNDWFIIPDSVVISDLNQDTTINFWATQQPKLKIIIDGTLLSGEADTTLNYYDTHTLDASGSSDPDSDIITYRWKQLSGTTPALSSYGDSIVHFYFTKIDTYIFQLNVTDSYGISSSETITIFGKDLIPPQEGNVIINGGAAYTGSLRVNLSISAEDTPATMEVTDIPDFSAHKLYENYTKNYAFTFSDTNEGVKRVYVRFYDKYGNMSTVSSDSIIYDITPPDISLDTTLSNTKIRDTVPINVYLLSTDIETVYLEANDTVIMEETINKDDTFTVFNLNTRILSDGTYKIRASATDFAGNFMTTQSYTIQIDNTAPHIQILKPVNGDTVGGDSLVIIISSSDTDIDTIYFYYSDNAGPPVRFYESHNVQTPVELNLSRFKELAHIRISVAVEDDIGNRRDNADTVDLRMNTAESVYGMSSFSIYYEKESSFAVGNGIKLSIPADASPRTDSVIISWELVIQNDTAGKTIAFSNGRNEYLLVNIKAVNTTNLDHLARLELPIPWSGSNISDYRAFFYAPALGKWVKQSNSWPSAGRGEWNTGNKVIALISTLGSYTAQVSNELPDKVYPAEKAYNYPNPVIGDFTNFRLYSLGNGEVQLSIFDLSGDKVKFIKTDVYKYTFKNIELNVRDIESGLYFYIVNFIYDDGTQKIIKGKMLITK